MKNKNLWKLLTNSALALSVGFSSLSTTFASGSDETTPDLPESLSIIGQTATEIGQTATDLINSNNDEQAQPLALAQSLAQSLAQQLAQYQAQAPAPALAQSLGTAQELALALARAQEPVSGSASSAAEPPTKRHKKGHTKQHATHNKAPLAPPQQEIHSQQEPLIEMAQQEWSQQELQPQPQQEPLIGMARQEMSPQQQALSRLRKQLQHELPDLNNLGQRLHSLSQEVAATQEQRDLVAKRGIPHLTDYVRHHVNLIKAHVTVAADDKSAADIAADVLRFFNINIDANIVYFIKADGGIEGYSPTKSALDVIIRVINCFRNDFHNDQGAVEPASDFRLETARLLIALLSPAGCWPTFGSVPAFASNNACAERIAGLLKP